MASLLDATTTPPSETLGGEAFPALGPAASQDAPAPPGPHPEPEAVCLLPTAIVRLVGPLHVVLESTVMAPPPAEPPVTARSGEYTDRMADPTGSLECSKKVVNTPPSLGLDEGAGAIIRPTSSYQRSLSLPGRVSVFPQLWRVIVDK